MAKRYIRLDVEHNEHNGGPGTFSVLAETGKLTVENLFTGSAFIAGSQANASLVVVRLDILSGAIPSIIVTGGWLYAVGDSPKVGTQSASASATGSTLIVVVEGATDHRFVHPFKGAVSTDGVTRKSTGQKQTFAPLAPSAILVKPSSIDLPMPIDQGTQDLIEQQIKPAVLSRGLKWEG